MRSVADVSDQRGADEPTDVPDRIDERDARGGAYSADSRRRESPEWTEHRGEPEHRQRQRAERRGEPVKRAAQRERRAAAHRRKGDVPPALTGAIRMAGGDNHADGAEHVRDRAQQPHLEVGASRFRFDDLRQPETHSVQRDRNREVHDREQPHAPAFHRSGGRARLGRACHGVLGQPSEKRFPLFATEPR